MKEKDTSIANKDDLISFNTEDKKDKNQDADKDIYLDLLEVDSFVE